MEAEIIKFKALYWDEIAIRELTAINPQIILMQ